MNMFKNYMMLIKMITIKKKNLHSAEESTKDLINPYLDIAKHTTLWLSSFWCQRNVQREGCLTATA